MATPSPGTWSSRSRGWRCGRSSRARLAPLDDRGWAASKAAGLLGIAWLVWLVCMLTPLPFTRATLAVALLLVGGAAWFRPLTRRRP